MPFESASQSVAQTRRLFEEVYAGLPQTGFDPTWVNQDGQFIPAAKVKLAFPVGTVDPVSRRRLMMIPTLRFGTVVLHDKWGDRGAIGPLAAAHPIGFDLIGHDLQLIAVCEKQVEQKYQLTGEVVESEALTPMFDQLLQELADGNASVVKLHSP